MTHAEEMAPPGFGEQVTPLAIEAASQECAPRPVGLIVNGQLAADPILIAGSSRRVLVRREDLVQSGLLPPAGTADLYIDGQAYVAPSAIDGLTVQLADDGETLIVRADPRVFPAVRLVRKDRTVTVDEIVPAAFLGYDATFSHWNGKSSATAYLDAGLSGKWGLLGTTAILNSDNTKVVRLETAYQRDLLDRRVRVVIGDSTTRAAEWNQPTRFAGIRVGTDFSLQPNAINFPVPTLSGSASTPSTIELIAQGGSQSLAVQPGPFLIDYQPVFNGAGEVTMTVTDSFGVSRRVTQSFYTSPRLLRPGLDDFSFEAGFLRENYGSRNFDYGDPFAAAFWRHGLTTFLTIAGRIEISPATRMAGGGFGFVLGNLGEVSFAGALSDSWKGRGSLWRAQLQRTGPAYSVTLSYQHDNGRFAQLGDAVQPNPGSPTPREELAFAGSISLGKMGDLSVSHVEARTSDGPDFSATTVGLSGNLHSAYYHAGVRRTRLEAGFENSAFVSVSIPLGARANASMSGDNARAIAMIGQSPPSDQGVGYQVAAGRESQTGEPIFSASALVRTQAGDFELSGDRNRGGQGIRLSARGALLAVAGKVVATPRLDYGFAVVEVQSDEDVTLFYENRPVVVKGGNGRKSVMTGLQPYAENRISIDIDAVPIDAEIDAAEKHVVPGYRQAVKVDFAGTGKTPVTVAFVGRDGAPLPAGLDVAVDSVPMGRTGYDGLAYFPDLTGGERVRISGPNYACEAVIPTKIKLTTAGHFDPVQCFIQD